MNIQPLFAKKSGFTLLELVIATALLIMAIGIALFATVGSNSLIERADGRSAVIESARTVVDTIRRSTTNAQAGQVALLAVRPDLIGTPNDPSYITSFVDQSALDAYNQVNGGHPYSTTGVLVKIFSQTQQQILCQVITRASVNTTSGEENYLPTNDATSGKTIAIIIYQLNNANNCQFDNPALQIYQSRLIDSQISVLDFGATILNPTVGCTACTNQPARQMRLKMSLKNTSIAATNSTEVKSPTIDVVTSLPVGLF